MKLEVNPYRWNQVDVGMFFGRESLLESVLRGVRRGDSFAVVGGRRMGKTMLLRRIEDALSAETGSRVGLCQLPIYVNAQELQQPPGADALYVAVIRGVERALLERGYERPGDGELVAILNEYGNEENRGFKATLLWVLWELKCDIRLVVLIDEMESVLATPWGQGFCQNWRQLLTNEPEVSFHLTCVVAGGKGLSRVSTDIGSPLSNVLTWKQLGLFTVSETAELVLSPTGGRISADDLGLIAKETGGHPFLIQYLMSIVAEGDLDDALQSIQGSSGEFVGESVGVDPPVPHGGFARDPLKTKTKTFLRRKNKKHSAPFR